MKIENLIYHTPVLLNETINGLKINPKGIYIDATYGGGGHSKEIMKKLTTGKLIAFDQDIDAKENIIEKDNFILIQANFRYIVHFIKYLKIAKVDGILADLGVSTHHFDMPERGFSFRFDAKLDMRMNIDSKLSANEVINNYKEWQLLYLFNNYGEIKNAYKLCKTIIQERKLKTLQTTHEFVEAIQTCVPKNKPSQYLAKVFQAIRIEVNNEMENLKQFLNQSVSVLKDDGLIAVISYHSLEDRLVKRFFKFGNFEGKLDKDIYGNIISPISPVNRKVITPSEEEIKINNRARSAKLRIGKKL